jgi:small subunit ribosomal protein S13
MARIAGVHIPDDKHVRIALRSIYGIGPTRSAEICKLAKVAPEAKVKDLTEVDLDKLRTEVDKFTTEAEGYRQLSWHAPSTWVASTWSTYQHQRSYPQRPEKTNS